MIVIESRKTTAKTILKSYPNAIIHDVTSKAEDEFIRFSPFFPIGNIPIPFSPGYFAECVEGIWQGLKIFETADVDTSKFFITTMKNIKRTTKKFGKMKGHRKGVNGKERLEYIDARKFIYLPSYKHILEHDEKIKELLAQIKEESRDHTVVLLDYETNCNVEDYSSPLSHASLIKAYAEGTFPEYSAAEEKK